MDCFNYQDEMDIFYAQISEFLDNDRRLFEELVERSSMFDLLPLPDKGKKKLFFDWFIFDCKSSICNTTPLRFFLENFKLSNEQKQTYKGFINNIYGMFEVIALKTGKEMIIKDILSEKEYNVKDTQLTKNVEKKQVIIVRILPFHGYYVATGMGHAFPLKVSPIIKMHLRIINSDVTNQSISPLDLVQLFFKEEQREKLPVLDKFLLVCQEGGLDKQDAESLLLKIKETSLRKDGQLTDFTDEVLKKLKPSQEETADEIIRSLSAVWNYFLKQEDKDHVEKGPIESLLISVMVQYIQTKVDPDKFKDIDSANKKADKLVKEWFDVPRQEFNGKSAKEVILEERQKLGNPLKEVGMIFRFKKTQLFGEHNEELEKLFAKGLECFEEENYDGAIDVFEEYCSKEKDNHVVWNNLGNAYVMAIKGFDKDKAKACYEKALEINPKYQLAKNNLENLKKRMASKDKDAFKKDRKVKWFNKGK
ncbi:MAG: hypothetical protein PHQ52_02650 [Candidatus Omnitrophica bacterium]|nr:hypothetical protein [Candidatus Omnitrophota bacterium]